MADPRSIAMMVMGKKPEPQAEPDGDEAPAGDDMHAQIVDELSAMDPKQLVDIVATVLSQNPDVLQAFQDALGGGGTPQSNDTGMGYGGAA